jgi:hypothetical protein
VVRGSFGLSAATACRCGQWPSSPSPAIRAAITGHQPGWASNLAGAGHRHPISLLFCPASLSGRGGLISLRECAFCRVPTRNRVVLKLNSRLESSGTFSVGYQHLRGLRARETVVRMCRVAWRLGLITDAAHNSLPLQNNSQYSFAGGFPLRRPARFVSAAATGALGNYQFLYVFEAE